MLKAYFYVIFIEEILLKPNIMDIQHPIPSQNKQSLRDLDHFLKYSLFLLCINHVICFKWLSM